MRLLKSIKEKYVWIFVLIIIFSSCKKILGIDTASQLKHTWKLTDLYSFRTVTWRNYTGSDIYSSLSACEKNNVFTFERNTGKGFWDCDTTSGNSIFFQWNVINDSALHMYFANSIPEYFSGSRFSTSSIDFEIYDIGSTRLQLERKVEQTGYSPANIRYVFTRQ